MNNFMQKKDIIFTKTFCFQFYYDVIISIIIILFCGMMKKKSSDAKKQKQQDNKKQNKLTKAKNSQQKTKPQIQKSQTKSSSHQFNYSLQSTSVGLTSQINLQQKQKNIIVLQYFSSQLSNKQESNQKIIKVMVHLAMADPTLQLLFQIYKNQIEKFLKHKQEQSCLNLQICQLYVQILQKYQKHNLLIEFYEHMIQHQIGKTNLLYYFNLGLSYSKLNKYDKTIFWFEESMKIQRVPLILQLLGDLYCKRHQEEYAIFYYEQCLRLDSQNTNGCKKIISLIRKNQNYIGQAQDLSETFFGKDDLQTYKVFGQLEARHGNLDISMEYLQKCLQKQGEHPAIYSLIANVKLSQDKLEQSIQASRKSLSLDPTQASASIWLGAALYQSDQTAEAISIYEKAIALDQNNSALQLYLGLIYYQENDYSLALKYFESATKKDLYNSSVQIIMSQIYMNLGKQNQAISLMEQCILQDPNAILYFNLANFYYHQQEYLKAIRYFQRCLQIDQNLLAAAYNIGVSLSILNRLEQAQPILKKSTENKPQESIYSAGYAICLTKMNRLDEAYQIFLNLVQKDRPYYQSYYYLGKIISLEDRNQKKLQDCLQLVSIRQNQPEQYFNLGLFYKGLKEPSQFFDCFCKSIDLLKKQLFTNETQTKRQINKFMKKMVQSLDALNRDYFDFQFVLLQGIINRDVGELKNAQKCLNKILLQVDSSSKWHSVSAKLIHFYNLHLFQILASSAEYWIMLVQFVLQQALEMDHFEAMLFYRYVHKENSILFLQNQAINHALSSKREERFDKFISVVSQLNDQKNAKFISDINLHRLAQKSQSELKHNFSFRSNQLQQMLNKVITSQDYPLYFLKRQFQKILSRILENLQIRSKEFQHQDSQAYQNNKAISILLLNWIYNQLAPFCWENATILQMFCEDCSKIFEHQAIELNTLAEWTNDLKKGLLAKTEVIKPELVEEMPAHNDSFISISSSFLYQSYKQEKEKQIFGNKFIPKKPSLTKSFILNNQHFSGPNLFQRELTKNPLNAEQISQKWHKSMIVAPCRESSSIIMPFDDQQQFYSSQQMDDDR